MIADMRSLFLSIMLSISFIVMAIMLEFATVRRKLNWQNHLFSSALVFSAIVAITLSPLFYPFLDYLFIEFLLITSIFFVVSFPSVKGIYWGLTVTAIMAIFTFQPYISVFANTGAEWFMISPSVLTAAVALYIRPPKSFLYMGGIVLGAGTLLLYHAYMDPSFWLILSYWPAVAAIDMIIAIVIYLFAKYQYNLPAVPDEDISTHKGFKFELRRKSVHILLAAINVTYIVAPYIMNLLYSAYTVVDPETAVRVEKIINNGFWAQGHFLLTFAIYMFLIPFVFVDILRLMFPDKRTPAKGFQYKNMRKRELDRLLGSSVVLIALSQGIAIVSPFESMALLFTTAFADAAGALIGTKFGKHKIGTRSVEGTTAELIMAFITIYMATMNPFLSAAGMVAFIIGDFLSDALNISDNLLIPWFLTVIFYIM